MTDKMVRCPCCRGANVMLRLGGILGECMACKGKGDIKECDLPKPVEVIPELPILEIVKQVAESVAVTDAPLTVPDDVQTKIDGKRAIFKRKTTTR